MTWRLSWMGLLQKTPNLQSNVWMHLSKKKLFRIRITSWEYAFKVMRTYLHKKPLHTMACFLAAMYRAIFWSAVGQSTLWSACECYPMEWNASIHAKLKCRILLLLSPVYTTSAQFWILCFDQSSYYFLAIIIVDQLKKGHYFLQPLLGVRLSVCLGRGKGMK